MTDSFLKIIQEKYPLTEIEAGEYARHKVKGMSFELKGYVAKGLGHVSVMKGKAMFGLMKMDTIVVNPFDKDMALFSYDRIHAMGNDTLFLEIYDTRLERAKLSNLDDVVARFSDLPDEPVAPNWYDDIKWPCSVKKKGKKTESARFDSLVKAFIDEYLRMCADAPACEREAKKQAASVYTEGLLNNGGPATDPFIEKYGREHTAQMFRRVMFGTGEPKA